MEILVLVGVEILILALVSALFTGARSSHGAPFRTVSYGWNILQGGYVCFEGVTIQRGFRKSRGSITVPRNNLTTSVRSGHPREIRYTVSLIERIHAISPNMIDARSVRVFFPTLDEADTFLRGCEAAFREACFEL